MSPLHFISFRVALAVYLLQHFLHLVPYAEELFSREGLFPDPSVLPSFGFFPNPLFVLDTPLFVGLLLLALSALSVLLALGFRTRLTALVLYCGWAILLSRAPFIANPSIPFVGLLLLGVAAAPSDIHDAHFRSATDLLWKGVWVLLALSYTISGLHKLGSPSWVDGTALTVLTQNPLARDYFVTEWLASSPLWLSKAMTWSALGLEILFAPLCLLRVLRPWVWLAMIALHLGILCLVSFADLTVGMLLVHLFTFDDRWIPRAKIVGGQSPIVFFDGECVMCNKFARLLLLLDKEKQFKLAPLQGETFQSSVSESVRSTMPDSIVVRSDDSALLSRSSAVLYLGNHLGGFARVLSTAGSFVPRPLRDSVYDIVARYRHRVFGKTGELCALIPKEERTRFLP